MKAITIEGQLRKEMGKKATKSVRNSDNIPCVLYGGEKNIHFFAKRTSFTKLIYTPEFHKVVIKIEGNEHEAIMKNYDMHSVTESILHIDFQELTTGRPITTEIPVKLIGIAEGVKEGGRQILKIRKLKVKTLPRYLLEHIEIDVTNVVLGQSVKVSDLDIEGYEFLDSDTSPIVTVEVQRLMKEDRILEAEAEALAAEEEAEAEAAALAEGEEGAPEAKEGEAKEGEKDAKPGEGTPEAAGAAKGAEEAKPPEKKD